MALIKAIKGMHPKIGEGCFLAETACVIGDVQIGDNCSIWFNSVIRGDVHYIRIGNNVNIQDGALIHGTYKVAPTNIGNNVSIAHGAIIHGCTIRDHVLIGMGAVIMDNVVIESHCIIAAGAVVSKNTHVKSGEVYGGMPAKKIKSVDQSLISGEIERISRSYSMYASWYKE